MAADGAAPPDDDFMLNGDDGVKHTPLKTKPPKKGVCETFQVKESVCSCDRVVMVNDDDAE